MTYKITDCTGETIEVWPSLELYTVHDFMGKKMPGLCIQLNFEDGPYATLTVCLGEFIGVKNCAYIDTNNCSFADQLLQQLPAQDMGLTRRSGYCEYPLWRFEEDFLRSIGSVNYERYHRGYGEEFERKMAKECYEWLFEKILPVSVDWIPRFTGNHENEYQRLCRAFGFKIFWDMDREEQARYLNKPMIDLDN